MIRKRSPAFGLKNRGDSVRELSYDFKKVRSPVFSGKIGVTPSLAAPGDTNDNDVTDQAVNAYVRSCMQI